jgi:hypothetical protein
VERLVERRQALDEDRVEVAQDSARHRQARPPLEGDEERDAQIAHVGGRCGRPQLQQAQSQLVARAVVLERPEVHESGEQAVHGRLRKAGGPGELAQGHHPRAVVEGVQEVEGLVEDRGDLCGA